MQQTEIEIGFIRLTNLKVYPGQEKKWNAVPDVIQAHKIIKSSGMPNFLSSCIPVQGPLRVEVWHSYLQGFWDQQLVHLIQYCFPLDFIREHTLQSTMDKHASALDYITDVEKYLSTELQHGTLIGPLTEPPFPTHISPLMIRPKHNLAKRRTIVD